jgi:type IV pilus assembly protein PilN
MRITLNLATRPFVELRPIFARLRLAMAALAVLAVLLSMGMHVLNEKASKAQSQMGALKAQTVAFEQERHTNESRMRQPQNMSVLERSKFLNDVFAQKSFSWTAVMMDLEKVLPAGVQVTSIDPAITKEGKVLIRLRVSGDRDRAVQLVRNLEGSRRFLSPRLSNEASQAQDAGGSGLAGGPRGVAAVQAPVAPGGVEFDILSGYNPLPPAPAALKKAVAAAAPAPRVAKKIVQKAAKPSPGTKAEGSR